MRTQLAEPNERLVGPSTYDELFTTHGVTMIFLFVIPMSLGAFGNYLVPLMIGARDMAFPRLNAFSFWLFAGSGCLIYVGLFMGTGPNAGWFDYVPLALRQYDPGRGVDFYALGLIFNGLSSTAAAANFIVTIFRLRAPGMSLNRMPLFCFANLAASLALVFALPALTIDLVFLELQRKLGFHFFDVAHGGLPLLWQNLFWIFGHPEVYIIVLPAFGIATSIIPTFARRRMVAFPLVALAELLVVFIGFGVWAHHMFATGLSTTTLVFFAGRLDDGGDPVGDPDLRLDAHGRLRDAGIPGTAPLHRRLHRVLRDRRPLGDHVRRDPVRPGLDRHVLRRRAPALRDLRSGGLPDPRRTVLLVPEGDRPHVPRALGGRDLLDRRGRDDAHVLPDAHRRPARDDAPRLHVRVGARLGHLQPDRDRRRVRPRRRPGADRGEPRLEPPARAARRARPVLRRHARMDDPLTAAALQLRGHPDGDERLSELGSGRPRGRRPAARAGRDLAARRPRDSVSTVADGFPDVAVSMPSESPWPMLLAACVTAIFALLLTSHYDAAGLAAVVGLICLFGWHSTEPEPA